MCMHTQDRREQITVPEESKQEDCTVMSLGGYVREGIVDSSMQQRPKDTSAIHRIIYRIVYELRAVVDSHILCTRPAVSEREPERATKAVPGKLSMFWCLDLKIYVV